MIYNRSDDDEITRNVRDLIKRRFSLALSIERAGKRKTCQDMCFVGSLIVSHTSRFIAAAVGNVKHP
jgi:hypothetical protein